MTVHFVGAGAAPCPPGATLIDTQYLDLDRIIAHLVDAHHRGEDVAQMCPGDPRRRCRPRSTPGWSGLVDVSSGNRSSSTTRGASVLVEWKMQKRGVADIRAAPSASRPDQLRELTSSLS